MNYIIGFLALLSLAIAHPMDEYRGRSSPDLSLAPTTKGRNLRGKWPSDDPSSTFGDDHQSMSIRKARTTFINFHGENMTPEEIIFFEGAWIRSFNEVFGGDDEEEETLPWLRSFVVDLDKLNDQGRRTKRVPLAKPSHGRYPKAPAPAPRWFDIWADMDFSCRLCPYDRRLQGKVNIELIHDLETNLCDDLRQGPFEAFRDLQECRIVYEDD